MSNPETMSFESFYFYLQALSISLVPERAATGREGEIR